MALIHVLHRCHWVYPGAAAVSAALTMSGCAPRDEGVVTAESTLASRPDSSATCFVADRSVLAREPGSPAPGPEHLAGWVRLELYAVADKAPATLVDSDGFSLDAVWSRRQGDTVTVSGFNDFVSIDMQLAASDSNASGTLTARSDAALERDSTGALREFRRTRPITLRRASCDSMPPRAGRDVIALSPGMPRRGILFDPSTLLRGKRVGTLVVDSVTTRPAVGDATLVGTAWFRGEIELSGWTLRNPDADLGRTITCFEADSTSSARLPRWSGDERRAWFCFTNRAEAARALGPPSEGVPATIVVDRFTIHRGLSDEVNSARFVRLVRGRGALRH